MIWMADMTLVRVTSNRLAQGLRWSLWFTLNQTWLAETSITHGWLEWGTSSMHRIVMFVILPGNPVGPFCVQGDVWKKWTDWDILGKKVGFVLGHIINPKILNSVSENPYFDCNMMIHEYFGTLFSEARLVPWCVVAAPPRVLWILGV